MRAIMQEEGSQDLVPGLLIGCTQACVGLEMKRLKESTEMIVKQVRRHLGLKLFVSYLIVIVVGTVVLASTTQLTVPGAIDRHMAVLASFSIIERFRASSEPPSSFI